MPNISGTAELMIFDGISWQRQNVCMLDRTSKRPLSKYGNQRRPTTAAAAAAMYFCKEPLFDLLSACNYL